MKKEFRSDEEVAEELAGIGEEVNDLADFTADSFSGTPFQQYKRADDVVLAIDNIICRLRNCSDFYEDLRADLMTDFRDDIVKEYNEICRKTGDMPCVLKRK